MTKATYRERIYLELMVPEEPESIIPRVGELTTGRQNGARIAAESSIFTQKQGIESTIPKWSKSFKTPMLAPNASAWPHFLIFLK